MTKIEWTHRPGTKGESWNPVRGCRAVSEGCRNCYAARQALRMAGRGQPYEGLVTKTTHGPRWTGEARLDEKALAKPLSWRTPRTVFVCSMADLFFEVVPEKWIDPVFDVMAGCPQHTFLVLTKRAERLQYYCDTAHRCGTHWLEYTPAQWPLPNVWLGTSVENQSAADERIPHLLATPAAVRFLSIEPLLGPVDLGHWLRPRQRPNNDGYRGDHAPGWTTNFTVIDWVIVGGESGPGARPMNPDWARGLRNQCAAASVPFFFKQWGEWGPYIGGIDDGEHVFEDGQAMYRFGKSAAGHLLDGKEHREWPK